MQIVFILTEMTQTRKSSKNLFRPILLGYKKFILHVSLVYFLELFCIEFLLLGKNYKTKSAMQC